MIRDELLRAIRNDLPMRVTIRNLGRRAPPSKHFAGYFRFLCPACGELRATVNPRNNLAHSATTSAQPSKCSNSAGTANVAPNSASHRSSRAIRAHDDHCADRRPRSDGPVDAILSSFRNNSVNSPNQAPNPYAFNSVKSATTIRPVTGDSYKTSS